MDAWTPKASAADWGTLRLIRAQIDSAAASALRGATYSDYGRRPNEVIQRDLEWIASDEIWPMSFAWCCQALDLEPAYVRGLIMERRWRTKNGKGWTAPAKWKPFR